MIYLVQLLPDINPRLFKVGRSDNVVRRLSSLRTTNPKAKLIGLWSGDAIIEKTILQECQKLRLIYQSEVLYGDLSKIKEIIDRQTTPIKWCSELGDETMVSVKTTPRVIAEWFERCLGFFNETETIEKMAICIDPEFQKPRLTLSNKNSSITCALKD